MAATPLVTQIATGFTEVNSQIKITRQRVGDLTSLATSAKGNLVVAVNELAARPVGGGDSGLQINDAAASGTDVYSSQKVVDLLAAQKAALVNGAGAALDTFQELSAALGDDADFAATTATALGNRLRFDAAQTLTSAQKTQALGNVGAISADDVGDITTDFATIVSAGLT